MKIWTPDTCPSPGCVVEELYSGSTITGPGVIVRKCSAHSSVPDDQLYGVLYSNVDGENKRKNQVVRALLGYEGFSVNLEATFTNPDGSSYIDFKNGVTVTWSYSGSGTSRILTIFLVGVNLTNAQKTTINNFCTTRFGAGKVVLVN